jgi:ornithine carbamoyltransferase
VHFTYVLKSRYAILLNRRKGGRQLQGRDLLSIADLTSEELRRIVDFAADMKRNGYPRLLAGKTLALLFEKASLRTNVSFNVACSNSADRRSTWARVKLG